MPTRFKYSTQEPITSQEEPTNECVHNIPITSWSFNPNKKVETIQPWRHIQTHVHKNQRKCTT